MPLSTHHGAGLVVTRMQHGRMGFIENTTGYACSGAETRTAQAQGHGAKKRFFYAASAWSTRREARQEDETFLRRRTSTRPARRRLRVGEVFPSAGAALPEDWKVRRRRAIHNVYGPFGTWEGGREKAPAAICRKVIEAKVSGKHEIEIWGDGNQTRSFMYISDCLKGIYMITESETWHDPINLGSAEGVTINQLVDVVEDIAGIKLKRRYNLDAPKGVNGRNSDNTLIKRSSADGTRHKLRDGLEKTYRWIYDQMASKQASR